MKAKFVWLGCLLLLPCVAAAASGDVERGRYLVKIGGCNDCHTAGYATSGGSVPEPQWLTGQTLGFKGPWGITYPANLRLLVRSLSEEEWIRRVGQPALPPMPWFSLREMSESDRRAIYRYILSLGPAGSAAPAYVAPGAPAPTPYILFVPQQEARQAETRGLPFKK